MLATIPRPVHTFKEALIEISSNRNYVMIFYYFQLVNTVALYGGEISSFTRPFEFGINHMTIASMIYCVSGILGSLYIGRILDKYKCFKFL